MKKIQAFEQHFPHYLKLTQITECIALRITNRCYVKNASFGTVQKKKRIIRFVDIIIFQYLVRLDKGVLTALFRRLLLFNNIKNKNEFKNQ